MLILFALVSSLACAANKDARPSPGAETLPEGGPPPAASAPPAVAVGISSTGAPAKTASSTTGRVGKDSAAKDPPITVPSVKGRTQKDSIALVKAVKAGLENTDWPVKTAPPLPGSILPAHRIVAFYGNPLSKKMGILGELPPDQMLARFDKEIAAWRKADPSTPVEPALHLIAVVAQGIPGRDGKYRLRMTDSLIDMVYSWAQKKNALLFLDVQVGQSTVQEELPRLIPFLQRPNVMLGIDPEFSMKFGDPPGRRIGTMSSTDVNYAIDLLSGLVKQYNLPPKVLIVHRFTHNMLTGSQKIRLDPRVQVVINMDGWGQPWLKYDSYRAYVQAEPVQFTGFKLFYHNDTKKGDPILTPGEVLLLNPKPLYIQYQ
ncbi:MAG: lipoprotein [Gemmatimonadaceae bacterium]